ncbi:MAG: hypothetical protein FWC76_02135 [Defluviitaleaceae bacterium]|nr:hypothetical protein [Defluviitaleaceae bacterium]
MDINGQGRKMLKVVGILYIVFSGINILVGLFGMGTAGLWDTIMPLPNVSWMTYYGMLFLVYAYTLFMGIMGLVHSNRPEKGGFLRVLGLVSIVAYIAFYVFGGLEAARFLGMVWLIPLDFVLPVLFIIGAMKNMKTQQ